MQAYLPRSLDVHQVRPRPIAEDVTVVIPTLGRSILEECLYWIIHGSVWPYELIVVDQGRGREVAQLIDKLPCLGIKSQYIPSDRRGRAAGLNRGLERVATRFVAITDDDCFVEAGWLEKMVACLRQHPEAVVTGRVEASTEDVIVVVTSRVPSVQRRPKLTFDHMSGGNMGTSLTVLDRVGLFDEHPSLRTSEDGEWSYRALKAGVSIYYEPDVCVRHFGWRDVTGRGNQYKYYARSHGGFYGKYLRQGDWFIAIRAALHHMRALRRWVRGTFSGDLEAASYGRAYVTGLLPGIIAGLRRKETG